MKTKKPAATKRLARVHAATSAPCPTCDVLPGVSCKPVTGAKIAKRTVWAHGMRIRAAHLAADAKITGNKLLGEEELKHEALKLARALAIYWRSKPELITFNGLRDYAIWASKLFENFEVEP